VLLAMLVMIPVAAAGAREPGGAPLEGRPGLSGFRQSAAVDQDTYDEGEAVVLDSRVCPSRPWPTWTNSPTQGPLRAEFRVLDDEGEVVADTTHQGYLLVLYLNRWWPGQCRSGQLMWDQHYWNQEDFDPERDGDVLGVSVRGDRVEPGAYRLEVWWVASPCDEPDDLAPEPIETSPFVLEP
jgi:hypothetical protein